MQGSHFIDWSSQSNQILYNPRMPVEEKEKLIAALDQLTEIKGHFLVATSGSAGPLKWTALAKEAVLLSASAVNRHLKCSAKDVWLNPLPIFHVAGLGVIARAFLSKAAVVTIYTEKWDATHYMQKLASSKATLSVLVPAQLYDLIALNQRAPDCVRAVVVGGGRLEESLYFKAIEKRWPILPSYGLTECCSQVATSDLGSWEKGEFPFLTPLDHMHVESDAAGYLKIKSCALFSGYLECLEAGVHFSDPKTKGWFHTNDLVEFKGNKIASLWRKDQVFKIGGESVSLSRLEKILQEEQDKLPTPMDAVLICMPDEKLGYVVQLATDSASELVSHLASQFNNRVFPFERIRKIHTFSVIPRSPLKKLLKSKLIEQCQIESVIDSDTPIA